ncbi:MAG TPA: hypothetical protein VHY77_11130, partial [Acidimicrobiales bacterium]|nr:hypothetical protein [Acidimicrobiales bacterium]
MSVVGNGDPEESWSTAGAAPGVGDVVVSEQQLSGRIAELGAEITADYANGPPPLLVGVLKGAFMFMADLSRAIDLPVDVDFMAV